MNSHLLPALVDSLNNDIHPLKGLFTRLWRVPLTVMVSPVFTVCAENVSSWILTNLLWSCACTPWASTRGAMDATADRIMTAPINTIIVVLIPVVTLHLGLPEKTKIYALLLVVLLPCRQVSSSPSWWYFCRIHHQKPSDRIDKIGLDKRWINSPNALQVVWCPAH